MSDIQGGIAAFDSENFLESGEDFGKAGALILFGRNVADVSLPEDYQKSYLVLAGFANAYGASGKVEQKLYNSVSVYHEDFMGGLDKIFGNGRRAKNA